MANIIFVCITSFTISEYFFSSNFSVFPNQHIAIIINSRIS